MEALVLCCKLGSINASPVASKDLPSWSSDHAGQTSWIPMRMLWPCREYDLRGNYHSTWSWMSTCAACFGEMFRAGPWRACSGCFAQILGRHRCPWAFVMLSAAFVSVRRKFVVRCAALLRRSSTCSAPRPRRACGKHGSSCKLSTTHRRGILLRTTWSSCTGFWPAARVLEASGSTLHNVESDFLVWKRLVWMCSRTLVCCNQC